MARRDLDLGMGCSKLAQTRGMWSEDGADHPPGHIVVQVDRRRVSHVEMPTGLGPDGDPTVTPRVAK
jgi:hypothetical protein